MIKIDSKGSFKNLENFLFKMTGNSIYSQLESYAQQGINALSDSTPKRTGKASNSWYYIINRTKQETTISWYNDDTVGGVPVVILLQYGHATGTGGYVEGEDFINPAIKPVFNEISDNVWKAVKSA